MQAKQNSFNILTALVLSAMLALIAAGCKSGQTSSMSSSAGSNTTASVTYKDGEYKAAAANFDDSGYKATVRVTVKDGAVESVDCDAEIKDGGTKKALSESGKYGMKAGGAQHEWHEEIALFEKWVAENGVDKVSTDKSGKTDAITGCTISVGDYVDLINEALDKAKK